MRLAEITTTRRLTRPAPRPAPPPLDGEFEHEELVVRTGERSGVPMAVAIHSTALGPALGGLRLWRYDSTAEAVGDVLRLARGMTMKAAAAGLDLGGGKGVICAPARSPELSAARRRAMLRDFGDLVDSLDGRYITAEDVGTGADDMVTIAERTEHVTGLPESAGGSGDPSPFTAMGVEAAMRACVESRFGTTELEGLEVTVVGLGHVGSRLAARLRTAGARLSVSDLDERKRGLAVRLEARWLDPGEALENGCDVLAPCALGGVIDHASVTRLHAGIVCGAANNQLAEEGLARRLADRGVLYAPDFLVNAGGLIGVYRELRGYDEDRARELATGIEGKMRDVLIAAEARGMTPLAAARELAFKRLDVAVRN